ncbi:MAG: CYTH domain-containing protein [Muribaculaceae bacterium]|nr:CYTH domain-containing protein [Muribaculaceae bacterium]
MAKEIERKYLVTDDSFKAMAYRSRHIVQAYLSTSRDATVRVRIIDDKAYITIKSCTIGCSRDEWEYEIPLQDARQMITGCHLDKLIDKIRYYVEYGGRTWEIDEFSGRLNGLAVAEIELDSTDETFDLPPFVGVEVTDDNRYFNSVLCTLSYPF